MATKKELDGLLGGDDTPKKPTIRRGQGLRLSTESQPETLQHETNQDNVQHPEEPIATQSPSTEQSQKRINAKSHNRTSAKTRSSADLPMRHKRVNRGYKLREDLIKACKRIALEEDRKLYEVMEEALAQYVAQKAQNQPG
jgi:hypothetical protein